MDTSRTISITVKMKVTIPQALALQAMFDYWTYCGNSGRSRRVSFFVDGDGNFRPQCEVTTSESIPELTDEIRNLAVAHDNDGNRHYDFDDIGWFLGST